MCVCVSGGSILSTRCSETYETKTALMSLFGLPLWYFSQSPRVVIQVSLGTGAADEWEEKLSIQLMRERYYYDRTMVLGIFIFTL